ncbi:MAG TPA: tol-pal system protein YbgF [Vicinamibacterales bacterium]|nr:tol-pal system protein YbgF [Vicinamibacterales bacterium]
MTGAIFGAALTLAIASPVLAADKETRQMMADIRILQEQSQQLQNLIASMTDALKSVNARLDEQTAASRKLFADQKLIIDTLANDVRVVREKVDDNNVRVGSLGQELDALRQSVTALGSMRPALPDGDPAATGDAAVAASSPAPSGAAAVGASPQKLLDSALADYYAGQYDLAILGFESYVKTFPQSPQASFAQLHVGNSQMQLGKYEPAIAAFDLVVRNYPKSNEVPDAYVRKGTALKTLRQTDRAREAFEFVIKNYPDSVAATVAQQRLQELLAQKP